MLDAARQVIRWSIPGWIFLFTFAFFQFVTAVICEFAPRVLFVSSTASLITPAIAALIFASSIPLGFIVYQIYYAMYGNFLPFGFVNRDRGAEILESLHKPVCEKLQRMCGSDIDLEKMYYEVDSPFFGNPLRRLEKQYRNKKGKQRYREKLKTNMEIVKFALNKMSGEKESSEFKNDYTSCSDIYHAIGASRTALLIGLAVYFPYNFLIHTEDFVVKFYQMSAAISLVLALSYLLLRVLERTRTSALFSAQAVLKHALHWYTLEEEADAVLEKVHDSFNLESMD